MLAVNARFHFDDLHFLWKLRDMSIWEYVSDMYFSRSGRFVGYFINGVVFKTILKIDAYWFFPIIFGFLGISLTLIGLRKLLKTKLNFLHINVIVLFYNIYVLTNIDFPVFFWLCAMSYYLLAPALLFLISEMLEKKNSFTNWILIVLLSIFLGGGQEAFTPIVMFSLFLVFIKVLSEYSFQFKLALKDSRSIKIIVAEIIILIALIIVIAAPGNYNRLSDVSEFQSPQSLIAYIVGFGHSISVFLYFVSFYFLYYIVLAFVINTAFGNTLNKIVAGKQMRFFLYSLAIYVVYVLLTAFPSVFLWGGFGIQRNYTHAVFVTMLVVCFWLILWLDSFHFLKQKFINLLQYIGVFTLILIMGMSLYEDIPSAKKYSRSVDSRISYLLQKKEQGQIETVEVEPIFVPYTKDVKWYFLGILNKNNNSTPVLYYISDTDIEPNEYSSHLSKFFNLDFQIKLKDKD